MEVPRLGVKSYSCQPTTYIHHSSQQHRILNPLSKARDQIGNLMVPGRICFCCATMVFIFFYYCWLPLFCLSVSAVPQSDPVILPSVFEYCCVAFITIISVARQVPTINRYLLLDAEKWLSLSRRWLQPWSASLQRCDLHTSITLNIVSSSMKFDKNSIYLPRPR